MIPLFLHFEAHVGTKKVGSSVPLLFADHFCKNNPTDQIFRLVAQHSSLEGNPFSKFIIVLAWRELFKSLLKIPRDSLKFLKILSDP